LGNLLDCTILVHIISCYFLLSTTIVSTASERDVSASVYTVWARRNAFLPRKVNMMMVLQKFDKNIQILNKLNSQK